MREKRRFQGPADSIPPRAKLELRVPRATSGTLDARSKPTPRRPASWRVPRKKRLETLPFAQFANLAARLRRRVPLRPRDRLDAPTSASPRFPARDAPSRFPRFPRFPQFSRVSNAARNLDAPLSASALFPARSLRVPEPASTRFPRAFLSASRDASLFVAPNAARSVSLPRPAPALFSSPRTTAGRAIFRAPEFPDVDSPSAPGDATRNSRLESTPFPCAVSRTLPAVAAASRLGGEEGAAERFESTLSAAASRSAPSLSIPFPAPSANPTRSRDAAAFGKDALLSAPNETLAPTLRRVDARFGTGRGRRDGGVEERGDTIGVASDSVAKTRRSGLRENDDSVSEKDALFCVNPMKYGASTHPNGRTKRGVSVLEPRDDSKRRPLRSVANYRFQTKTAPPDARNAASTSPEGFETRRFALDRGDRGVSTLGADALEGRGHFREEAWGASFAGRGSVETTRSATLGSLSGRRAATTQWPRMETPRESANLATIERLLKESRDALVNLARDSKGDWTLDVE